MFLSRLAPTPSGFLHKGNVLNFLITQHLTKINNGKLNLRIDDSDQSRVRNEYIEDIIEVCKWLNIDFDKAPKNLNDFNQNFSQKRYFEKIKQLIIKSSKLSYSNSSVDPLVFSCHCSRKEILKSSLEGNYPGTCYGQKNIYFDSKYALRLRTPHLKTIEINQSVYCPSVNIFDPILWKKDQTPSYHLTSIIDDIEAGVTHIIRGLDLLDSSIIQRQIAHTLKLEQFIKVELFHHPLILSHDGEKLSKSTLAHQTKSLIDIYQNKEQLLEDLGEGLAIDLLKGKTQSQFNWDQMMTTS